MDKANRSPADYAFILGALLLLLSVDTHRDLFAQDSGKYFQIQVVDDQTGRGVPLVALATRSDISYYTDSNGIIAFYEPSLMNQTVCFSVTTFGIKRLTILEEPAENPIHLFILLLMMMVGADRILRCAGVDEHDVLRYLLHDPHHHHPHRTCAKE